MGTAYASFTFQVQDNGGTANGGVDLDPSPNTITVNVTSVNDAPAGTNKTVTTLEDTAYTFTAADFGFTDPSDSPANNLLAVKITTLPAAGTLTDNGVAVTAGQFITLADITAGLLKFTPVANANGSAYASFTFQVQDDGGTANGGVDLDPIAQHDHHQRHLGQRRSGRHQQDGHHAGRHGLHVHGGRLRLHRSQRRAGQHPVGRQDHHAAGGRHADRQRRGGDRRPVHHAGRHHGRLAQVHARPPMPTAQATPASRSRCRTTAARPTAASISIQSPNTITINVTSVNDAPAGTDKTVTTLEDTAYTFTAADFGFTDPNDSPANTLLAVKITTLPAAGDLTNNGVAVTAGQFITLANITAGLLQVHAGRQCQRHGYTSFTFQVQDNGGTANGGVDLDPVAQHDHRQRHLGQRRSGRHRTRRSPRWKTRPTRSRRPTSASPIPTTRRPTPCWP